MPLPHRIMVVLAISLLTLPAPASDSPPKPLHWPIYRGDAARSNRGAGGPPVLQELWRQSMFFRSEYNSPRAAKERIRQAEKKSLQIIPAFSPIALTVFGNKGEKKPLLVYKSYFGVTAVDLRNGAYAWVSPSNWGLQRMLNSSDSRQRAAIEWLDDHNKQYPQIVFENSTTGTLSTDGRSVYVVDDFAVPPRIARQRQDGHIYTPASTESFSFSDLFGVPHGAETEDAILHNRLLALDLSRTGALSWTLGEDEKDLRDECYFLGPPLPIDGMLYVLIQKKQEISLLCITLQADKPRRLRPKIIFMKPLVETATSLLEDPMRRIQAAHLASADGILVCPTNAGVVFGIDLATRWHAWIYPYRKKTEKRKAPPAPAFAQNKIVVGRPGDSSIPGNPNRWKTTAPAIAEGKVVFTPPDDPSIHCLNLSDGALKWSRKKDDDDVYLGGVYDGKVLIVGVKNVRALSLANGETLWTRETGLPSGQGVASGDAYYLPLQRGTQSKQPEICVLDIKTGRATDHLKTRPRTPNGTDFDVPGNLVFVEGKLISQSPWEIVAYPTDLKDAKDAKDAKDISPWRP